MNYGLLMPCKIVQVIDATHYAVALAGQVEIEIHLMEVRANGITAPKVIDQIEATLKAELHLGDHLLHEHIAPEIERLHIAIGASRLRDIEAHREAVDLSHEAIRSRG